MDFGKGVFLFVEHQIKWPQKTNFVLFGARLLKKSFGAPPWWVLMVKGAHHQNRKSTNTLSVTRTGRGPRARCDAPATTPP